MDADASKEAEPQPNLVRVFVGQTPSSARDPLVAPLRPTGLQGRADQGVCPTKIVAECGRARVTQKSVCRGLPQVVDSRLVSGAVTQNPGLRSIVKDLPHARVQCLCRL